MTSSRAPVLADKGGDRMQGAARTFSKNGFLHENPHRSHEKKEKIKNEIKNENKK